LTIISLPRQGAKAAFVCYQSTLDHLLAPDSCTLSHLYTKELRLVTDRARIDPRYDPGNVPVGLYPPKGIEELNDIQINIAKSRNSIAYVITEPLNRSFEIFSFEGTSFNFRSVSGNLVSIHIEKKLVYFGLDQF
jgi:hypothetical protein